MALHHLTHTPHSCTHIPHHIRALHVVAVSAAGNARHQHTRPGATPYPLVAHSTPAHAPGAAD
eukprot:3640591-Rhodomonas_salina.1